MASEEVKEEGKDIYTVNISIIRGIQLGKANSTVKPSPFVNVSCLNRKFKTEIIQQASDAQWDAKTQFEFSEKPNSVLFQVRNWSKTSYSSSPLGEYTLDIKEFFEPNHPGFEKCVKLEKIGHGRGQIEIKVDCQRIGSFQLVEDVQKYQSLVESNKEKIAKSDQQCNDAKALTQRLEQEVAGSRTAVADIQKQIETETNSLKLSREKGRGLEGDIENLEDEIQTMQRQYDELKQTYKSEKQKLKDVKAESEQKEDTKSKDGDATGQVTDGIMESIKGYIDNFNADDEKEEVKYDESIFSRILNQFKLKSDEATEHENKRNEYAQDDTKTEHVHEEFRKYQKAKRQADEYLVQLQRFTNDCDEQLEIKKEKYLVILEYETTGESNFFRDFYKSLCKYFIYSQIISSTFEIYGDEIKKQTGKSLKKLTFEDLQKSGVWQNLYAQNDHNLDYVMEEMAGYLSEFIIRTKSIKSLCDETNKFIKSYHGGNYSRFSYLVSRYISELVMEQQVQMGDKTVDNVYHILDDLLGSMVLIFTDKRSFLYEFHKSITENEEEDKFQFEMMTALIVIKLITLDDVGDDILTEEDRKEIKGASDEVLTACAKHQIDAKSTKSVEKFFHDFFEPEQGMNLSGLQKLGLSVIVSPPIIFAAIKGWTNAAQSEYSLNDHSKYLKYAKLGTCCCLISVAILPVMVAMGPIRRSSGTDEKEKGSISRQKRFNLALLGNIVLCYAGVIAISYGVSALYGIKRKYPQGFEDWKSVYNVHTALFSLATKDSVK